MEDDVVDGQGCGGADLGADGGWVEEGDGADDDRGDKDRGAQQLAHADQHHLVGLGVRWKERVFVCVGG